MNTILSFLSAHKYRLVIIYKTSMIKKLIIKKLRWPTRCHCLFKRAGSLLLLPLLAMYQIPTYQTLLCYMVKYLKKNVCELGKYTSRCIIHSTLWYYIRPQPWYTVYRKSKWSNNYFSIQLFYRFICDIQTKFEWYIFIISIVKHVCVMFLPKVVLKILNHYKNICIFIST